MSVSRRKNKDRSSSSEGSFIVDDDQTTSGSDSLDERELKGGGRSRSRRRAKKPASKRQKRDREPSRKSVAEEECSSSTDASGSLIEVPITRSRNRNEVVLPKLNRHIDSSSSADEDGDIEDEGDEVAGPSTRRKKKGNAAQKKGKKALNERKLSDEDYTTTDEEEDEVMPVSSDDDDFVSTRKSKKVKKVTMTKVGRMKVTGKSNSKRKDEIDPLTLDGSDTETDGGQSDGGYCKLHGKEELNTNAENEEESSEDNHTDYDDEDYSYSDASGSEEEEEEEEEDELQPSESASQGCEHPKYELQKWKNKEKDELVSDWNATIKDLKKVDMLKVKNFNVLYDRISSATEILPKITKESYILLPPKDIEAYREACRKVAKVEQEDRRYPCYVCNKKLKTRDSLKDHVRSVHLHDEPYQCGICPLKLGTQFGIERHIESFHLFITYPCRLCGYKFSAKSIRNKHETGGHVPRNKKLYVYATSGKITYRRQKRTDVVYCKDGKTFQIIIGLCRKKPKTELKRGAKSGVVASYTSFGNAVKAMDHLCKNLTKGAKSPNTKKEGKTRKRHCFARHEIVKRKTIDPRETIVLRIYCLSEDLATQLKGWFRRYLNAICVLKTPETEIILRNHESHLKAAVDKIFSQLPLTTRNFINRN